MPIGSASAFGIVLPVSKTNIFSNPSLERDATNWASQTGFAVRSSGAQAFGAWCYQIPTNSAGTLDMAAGPWTAGVGTAYTVSIYAKVQTGKTLRVGVLTTANYATGAWLGSTAFTTGGTWQRYSVSYTEASGGGNRFIEAYIETAATTAPFSVDGAMVEVGSQTTYVDGDEDGCYWLGAPHASQSARSGTYRGGGSVVALADLGLRVDQALGIGMMPLENTAMSFALTDGAEYQHTRAKERPFTLTAYVGGTTQRDYHVTRRTILNALKIDVVDPQQPLRLWYVGGEGTVTIDAVLDAGMEGQQKIGQTGFGENAAIRFIAHDPYWHATTDEGTTLASRVNLGSTNWIACRDPQGRWGTMGVNGSTFDNQVLTMAMSPSGTLFAGGQFGSAAGSAVGGVAMYMPTNGLWGTLTGGTLTNTSVLSLVFSPAGTLYAGGLFGPIAGTAQKNLAQWNGAWGTLAGGSANQLVEALVFSPNGTLFVGGNFTAIGGTTYPAVGMWFPDTKKFGTLQGGTIGNGATTGTAYSLAMDASGVLYIGGVSVTTAGGTASANDIASWRSGTFGTLAGGMALGGAGGFVRVSSIAVGPDQRVYIGGHFGTAGGGSVQNISVWNGVSHTALATGIGTNGATGVIGVTAIFVQQSGELVAVGNTLGTLAGAIPLPDGGARWNGYAWTPLDISHQAFFDTYAVVRDNAGTVYFGGAFAGTAQAAAVAQVPNTGMADAYPIVKMRYTGATGTCRPYQLLNGLTGDRVFFNIAMIPGEELTLDLTPGARSFTSDFRGNVFGKILAGSNLSTWRLLPGVNYVSFFADSDNLSTSIFWRTRGHSADSGTAV